MRRTLRGPLWDIRLTKEYVGIAAHARHCEAPKASVATLDHGIAKTVVARSDFE